MYRYYWATVLPVILFVRPSLVLAAPPSVPRPHKRQSSGGGDNDPTFKTSIYVPVIVIAAAFVLIVCGVIVRNRLRQAHLRQVYSSSNRAQGPQTVQITAAQLNGGTDSATQPATTTTRTERPRRARRNRRRPSQASVTSLPLYMEEAGDTELVLVRGEREMEDPMHDGHDTHSDSDGEPEYDHHPLTEEPTTTISRPSYDSGDSDGHGREPTSALMGHERNQSTQSNVTSIGTLEIAPDTPQGEAPPYSEMPPIVSGSGFREVVSPPPTEPAAPVVPNSSNTTNSQGGSTRRMPMPNMPNLRNLFSRNPSGSDSSRRGGRAIAPSASRTHLLSHQRSTSSFSNNSSLHLTPTISRLSANHHLSPNASTISLASISAPLAHTLTRTEIAYPRSGPTEEQMKFISSRESLAKFGVPFGSAAIAYSREDPPPFPDHIDRVDVGSNSQSHTREETDATIVPRSQPTRPAQEEYSATESSTDVRHEETRQERPSDPSTSEGKETDVHSPTSVSAAASSTASFETAHTAPSPALPEMSTSITIRGPSPGPPTPPPTPPRTTTPAAAVPEIAVGVAV